MSFLLLKRRSRKIEAASVIAEMKGDTEGKCPLFRWISLIHCNFSLISSIIRILVSGGAYMDKTVLEKYTKTYGTRFSRRQKKRFIEALH